MAPAPYLKLRIAFATIGIFVGLSIFFCFSLAYNNWDTAVWGLFSGLFAGVTLMVHIRYKVDKWMTSAYQLRRWMLLGCLAQLGAVCGFVAYMSIAINEGQALTPYGPRAYYLTCVWCFMTWKWGFGLLYYSRDYKRRYEEETGQSISGGKYEQI